jgi:hypothetical protein
MMNTFSDEEIRHEQARRRSRSKYDNGTTMLRCVHCGMEFDPAKGGNPNMPLCDHCLHGSE